MSGIYQEHDAPHYDYDLVRVPGLGDERFRGPVPDLSQPYFAVVGGAQAFGRFTATPFPHQLATRLGLPCLNLGIGGAGPRWALQPAVLALLTKARFVVVQMFSGRSASNSWFDNSEHGRNSGRLVGHDLHVAFEAAFDLVLARGDRRLTKRIVAETREDFAFYTGELARVLPVPTVLLWLSQREPDYEPDWATNFGCSNHYPQFIDAATLGRIRPEYDAYVECASAVGLPQRLWPSDVDVLGADRGADGLVENRYYPSPQMHDLAAELLEPVCRELQRG
ncbi:MAG: DUF6473 family protein [bacterium]|nr:DUF6473 family protein [bacterium]